MNQWHMGSGTSGVGRLEPDLNWITPVGVRIETLETRDSKNFPPDVKRMIAGL